MNELFNFILEQAQNAHFYIFGLFLLAGFNIPVSEDLLIVSGAIISVNFAPHNATVLFLACYMGAYLSDIICYFVGRRLGPRIISVKPFSKLINRKRLDTIAGFYAKYGIWALFFGRFIPFGVRNALFMSAGISKMNFGKFALVDLVSCTITTLILFSLGRSFAENYEVLFDHIARSKWFIGGLAALVVLFLWYLRRKKLSGSPGDALS